MSKQINLRLPKEILVPIENYQLKNNHEDIQDAIREILEKYIKDENIQKGFFQKLKILFFN